MSTRIDYKRRAYFSNDAVYGDRHITVIVEAGDNNCYEIGSGRRARSEYVIFDGSEYSVYGEVSRYAASAAGGMLVIARMGTWKSGAYLQNINRVLRAYDKAIKNAKPIESVEGWDKQIIDEYRRKKAEVAS